MKIPRKSLKFKTKSSNKIKIRSNIPRSTYEYSIYQLKILSHKKKKDHKIHKQLLPLRRTLIHLFNKGRITYHKPDYISTNQDFLRSYFTSHPNKLISIKHPEFNRLSKIYYSIKRLVII